MIIQKHVLYTNRTHVSKCTYLANYINFQSLTFWIEQNIHKKVWCKSNTRFFYYPKGKEPLLCIPFHEFEFEVDSSISEKINIVVKPSNELADKIEKVPMSNVFLEKLTIDGELEVKKIIVQSSKEKI